MTVLTYSHDACGNLTGQKPTSASVPQITGQPVNQLVGVRDFTSFSVLVSNTSGVTFQWAHNGTDIAGATADSLLLPTVGAADVGRYSVTVTNSQGSVTSTAATLTLDTGTSPAPVRLRLSAYGDLGGSVEVTPMKLDYESGETVTLTAVPTAPNVFVGWAGELDTGELVSTTNPVTFPMNQNKTVRARFASAVSIPSGLVANWRGETDATDLLGEHDGTFFAGTSVTAPSVTAQGKVSGAFSFDGTVHVRVPDSAALHLARLTVELWLVPTVLSGIHQTVIARGSSTNNNDTWYLGLLNGRPRFWSHGDVLLEGPSTIPLNRWTHLAVSFDGSTKRLFVNGLQVASHAGLGALVYDPAPVPVTIGADWSSNGPSELFTGRVDEVALYNRALTADEIAGIYNADFVGKNITEPYFTSPSQLPEVAIRGDYAQQLTTTLGTAPISFSLSAGALPPGIILSSAGAISGASSVAGVFDFTVRAVDAADLYNEQLFVLPVVDSVPAPAGLVGWWRAEGNAQDAAGTNHGTLRNGAGFATGKVGRAFSLDGTDDSIEISDAPALRPASLTLEAWVAFDGISGLRAIFAKPVGGGSSDSYSMWLASGTLRGVVGNQTGNGPELFAPFAPALEHWYHLAYTFDDSTDRHALYIDGAQVTTGTVTTSIGYDPQPLLLGRDTESGTPNFFLKGRIDEAAIYNRALSGAEIASIYNAGPAGKRT
jgi:hypothetical protein